jgi:Spy/CpxP family protein refolding chaperone
MTFDDWDITRTWVAARQAERRHAEEMFRKFEEALLEIAKLRKEVDLLMEQRLTPW